MKYWKKFLLIDNKFSLTGGLFHDIFCVKVIDWQLW